MIHRQTHSINMIFTKIIIERDLTHTSQFVDSRWTHRNSIKISLGHDDAVIIKYDKFCYERTYKFMIKDINKKLC